MAVLSDLNNVLYTYVKIVNVLESPGTLKRFVTNDILQHSLSLSIDESRSCFHPRS